MILVPKASTLASVAELKGKRIALQKGSSAHNLLLRGLAKAGLSIRDVQPVYLAPADARAAFERGSVDAWAIWDPFYSAIDVEGKARVLADGQGLGLIGPFMLGARGYVEANPEFVGQLLYNWANHFTGPAPFGPEVNQNGFIGVNEVIEISVGCFQSVCSYCHSCNSFM